MVIILPDSATTSQVDVFRVSGVADPALSLSLSKGLEEEEVVVTAVALWLLCLKGKSGEEE